MTLELRKRNVLYVQTFGAFSMVWNDKVISDPNETERDSFRSLMQLILHHREQGVARSQVEEVLFPDREIGNVRQAMQRVLSHTRELLMEWELPAVNFIEHRNGRLYWTREIPVVEDAAEFECLYHAAQAETLPDRKTELLLDACHCYTGEFLGEQANEIWIVQEAERYRTLFFACVERVAAQLREEQDYIRMEELGVYTTEKAPFSHWETVTMEALIAQGRYRDAQRLYEKTAEDYFLGQGLSPSDRLVELMNQTGDRYKRLDNIQRQMEELSQRPTGGYLCNLPVFQGVYQLLKRMMERSGQSIYLMLCSAVDSDGRPIQDKELLESISQRLQDAILRSVRKGDVVNQYKPGEYLVLLINTTRENCGIVQKRINYHFSDALQRFGIHYYVNRVSTAQSGMDKGAGQRTSDT